MVVAEAQRPIHNPLLMRCMMVVPAILLQIANSEERSQMISSVVQVVVSQAQFGIQKKIMTPSVPSMTASFAQYGDNISFNARIKCIGFSPFIG